MEVFMRGQQNYYTDDQEEYIAIPADILEQIDEQLGYRYKNRTDFIRAATISYITKRSNTVAKSNLQHAM